MAVSKYWGDERQSDAIYAVYLKKVRYVPPQQYEGLPHYRPIDPDNHHLASEIENGSLDHLQWETIRERIIKAGTLDKLVESLINMEDQRMDSRQFNVFFATYRAFSDPEAVLNKFLNWYESLANASTGINNHDIAPSSKGANSMQILKTIRSILSCWLDTYPEDFYQANEQGKFYLLNQLVSFARSRGMDDLKRKAQKIRERFRHIHGTGGLTAQIPSIRSYSYANNICYDPHDYEYAQHRAQMFDINRDNCVQIAEQLTFWDAELFRELRPYQCQGAIWGKRQKMPDAVYSVRATIDQFNAVSQRVMTSIVFPNCQPEFRARIIEKWIDIAGELRALKNFSSLKAVLSSLQSEPVYRLKSTWAVLSKTSVVQFKELATIFDADENGDESKARKILDNEGTAKNSPSKKSNSLQNCRRTKSDVNLADSQGTVPFLGTFLTDLTMIDQAHYDNTSEGLINFEKRRREFEVLAKIRLFQSAACAYKIPMDQAFCVWFYYLPSLNENECFAKSLEVESISTLTPDTRRRAPKGTINNFYSSTGPSTSKFHSLTKIFANISTNENGDTNVSSVGLSPDQNSNSVRPTRDQTPSSSFTGQRSNDSGIHTEEHFGSNNNDQMPSTSSVKSPEFQSFIVQSDNERVVNMAADNFRSMTAPPTPAGTLRGNGKVTENGLNYSQFSSQQPQSVIDSGFGDYSDSTALTNKKPSSRSSTPARNSGHNRHQVGNGANIMSVDIHPSHSSNSLNVTGPHYCYAHNNKPHQASQKSTSSSSCSSYGSMASPLTIGGGNFLHRVGSSYSGLPPHPPTKDFHLARVGLDDSMRGDRADIENINYKCIKVENGDRMVVLIERALEKHMIDVGETANYFLVQLLPDGSELKLPDYCNPFYAVAPDPTSPMLNFLLKKRQNNASDPNADTASIISTGKNFGDTLVAPSAKKLNRQKRSNLLRWSSGYL